MSATRASILKELKAEGFRVQKGDNGVDLVIAEDGRVLGGVDDEAGDDTRKNLFESIRLATGRSIA